MLSNDRARAFVQGSGTRASPSGFNAGSKTANARQRAASDPDTNGRRDGVRSSSNCARTTMKRIWSSYNLSIVLIVLFNVTWMLQGWTGRVEYASEQQQHG